MSSQERIAALEGMLERIQRNAARPRPVAAVATAPPAPAPQRAPSAPPAPPAPDPVFDRTVDELLEAPIPLVQMTSPQRGFAVEPLSLEPPAVTRSHQPPPRDEAQLEAEEAAIPMIMGGADSPALSGVQLAGQAEVSEELAEDDLISVAPEANKSVPPPVIEIPVHDDLDFDDEEEEADEEEEIPASSQRPRIATIEEALAAAPEPLYEHEAPIKTPPPESGPQEAMPPPVMLEAPRLPEIREAFERGPTPEQLGETIELPEASDAELELDERAGEPPTLEVHSVSEELEVSLPTREMANAFDVNLAPPASAREEIRRYDEQSATEPEEPLEATQVVRRRELAGTTVSKIMAQAGEFSPRSFVELLEATLRLGSE